MSMLVFYTFKKQFGPFRGYNRVRTFSQKEHQDATENGNLLGLKPVRGNVTM